MEPGKRYTVRPRYVGPAEGGGHAGAQVYQVVYGAKVIGNHLTTEAAAEQVLSLRGRIACKWVRTMIGGKTTAKDFAAKWLDNDVGRMYWDQGTSHTGGTWRWFEFAHLPGKSLGGGRGSEDDRLVAAAALELAFTQHLARAPYGS